MGANDERGSVIPLWALVLVAVAGLCVGMGRLGSQVALAARVSAAADAAALAGAAEGEEAARALAEANGAELVAWRDEGDEVQVEVALGGATARARAAASPGTALDAAGAPGSANGLRPEVLAALARAEAALGEAVPISSGWRSPAQQQALWDARASNPYPVARPGTSNHERGLAVDVPRAFTPRLAAVGPEVGLCQPLPRTDPVHFEACPKPAP